MEACELLRVELRLDRIEAELARELPHHMRAFAEAHAHSTPPPPAPAVLLRSSTLATARAAVAHSILADRGLALARLAASLAIESDPAVTAARAAPVSWRSLATLTAARDAASLLHLGRRALDALHRLHGTPDALHRLHGTPDATALATRSSPDAATHTEPGRSFAEHAAAIALAQLTSTLPVAIAAWTQPDGVALDEPAISALWQTLRASHGVDGIVRFERSATARPRAFVVEPGREVILVLPAALMTPAARFAVLHELGHAIAALALPAGIPRVVDEAAAAYIARLMEHPTAVEGPWYSAVARAARARRGALARALAALEHQLARPASHAMSAEPTADMPVPGKPTADMPLPGKPTADMPVRASAPPHTEHLVERPPWALWHDPGAQAAYVAAEQLADALSHALGPAPRPGALTAQLAARRAAIDHETTL